MKSPGNKWQRHLLRCHLLPNAMNLLLDCPPLSLHISSCLSLSFSLLTVFFALEFPAQPSSQWVLLEILLQF